MQSPSDLGAMPVFQTPPKEAEAEMEDAEPIPPSSPDPSTSERPSEPAARPGSVPTSSTKTSTDLHALDEPLGELVSGAAQAVGLILNRLARKRRGPTDLWVMAPDEAAAIGAPLGSLAAARAPEELAKGDGPGLLSSGAALLGYLLHNALGVSAADMERAVEAGPVAPPAVPTPAPPVRATVVTPAPDAPAPAPGGVDGVTKATPPPPGVPISL